MNKNKIIMALICYMLLAICVIVTFVCEFITNTKSKLQEQENEVVESEQETVEQQYPIVDIFPENETTQKEKESEIYLLTAYCPCYECSEGYGNKTAIGRQAVEGRTIAVDPTVIEYGTEVYIDGKMYVAEDCGGLVKGKHIDIYFDSHDKVDAFGKKYAEVEI